MLRIGRNDPCPCGSGKKHKKCCGGNNSFDNFDVSGSTCEDAREKDINTFGENELVAKLRRIEALFAGTNFEGEKAAAKNALDRIRERLRKIREIDPPVEYKFGMVDMWSRRLFVSLCRRYDIDTYRYSGQKYTTVMALVSKSFVDETLWPEFQELDKTLRKYINDVTDRVIRETIHGDNSEVEVRQEKRFIASGK